MQIKRLEDEVGKKLFERIGKTVKLTAEGNILIKYAANIDYIKILSAKIWQSKAAKHGQKANKK